MPGLDENEIRQTPLWNHMVSVLSHIVCEQPASALETLLPTSDLVTTGSAVPQRGSNIYRDTHPIAKWDVPPDALVNTRWAANFGRVLAPPKPLRKPAEGDEDEEDPAPAEEEPEEELPGTVADVVAEQAFFNMVGAGLPTDESFRVVVGLRQLVKTEPLASARLWGKIQGSRSDYYIAETRIDPARVPEEDEDEIEEEEEEGAPVEQIADILFGHAARRHHSVPAEEAGTGLNELTFYAASVSDPTRWTRLPDVTPQQITAAQRICHAFTGDLEAPVLSHPRFPGKEASYLRAQIARITSACRVAPRDIFTTEGAVPEEEEDEEGNIIPPPATVPAYTTVPPLNPQEMPDEDDPESIAPVKAWFYGYPDEELLQGKYWVHIAPTLLKEGRVTAAPPPEADENINAGAEPEDPIGQPELINPFLSDVTKDAAMTFPGHSRSNFPAWTFRKGFHNESSKHSVFVARSTRWPGAMTYAVTKLSKPGAQYEMMYIGTGLKNLQGVEYAPRLPPLTMKEYPEEGLVMERDATIDEELDYAPLPPKPGRGAAEEEEEDD